MPDPDTPHGLKVPDDEELHRAIIDPRWWRENRNPPVTSMTFNYPSFSSRIASRTTIKETLSKFRPGSGLVQYNCGRARGLNFDARDERDPKYPEDIAHTNVYSNHSNSQRKKKARALCKLCTIIKKPAL